MVVLEGDAAGQIVLRGAGAGEGPTASAVMSDVHRHRARHPPVDLRPARQLAGETHAAPTPRSPRPTTCAWRCRTNPARWPRWRPCWATPASRSTGCGSTSTTQTTAPVLIVTHKTSREALDKALTGMAATGVVEGPPVAIRIEAV